MTKLFGEARSSTESRGHPTLPPPPPTPPQSRVGPRRALPRRPSPLTPPSWPNARLGGRIGALSRFPRERFAHPLERDLRLAEHELGVEAQHPPPKPRELAIAAGIARRAPRVAATIDFDDELRARHREVSHEFPNDHLPADGNTELPRTDQAKQRLLAPGGSRAHGRSARKEELTAFLFPMHEDLLARRRVRALPDHGAGGVTGAQERGGAMSSALEASLVLHRTDAPRNSSRGHPFAMR